MGCLQYVLGDDPADMSRISETDHAAASFGFAGVKKANSL